MIRLGIIEGFKPKLNIGKLGYQWYLLLLQFQKLTEKRKNEFITVWVNTPQLAATSFNN